MGVVTEGTGKETKSVSTKTRGEMVAGVATRTSRQNSVNSSQGHSQRRLSAVKSSKRNIGSANSSANGTPSGKNQSKLNVSIKNHDEMTLLQTKSTPSKSLYHDYRNSQSSTKKRQQRIEMLQAISGGMAAKRADNILSTLTQEENAPDHERLGSLRVQTSSKEFTVA